MSHRPLWLPLVSVRLVLALATLAVIGLAAGMRLPNASPARAQSPPSSCVPGTVDAFVPCVSLVRATFPPTECSGYRVRARITLCQAEPSEMITIRIYDANEWLTHPPRRTEYRYVGVSPYDYVSDLLTFVPLAIEVEPSDESSDLTFECITAVAHCDGNSQCLPSTACNPNGNDECYIIQMTQACYGGDHASLNLDVESLPDCDVYRLSISAVLCQAGDIGAFEVWIFDENNVLLEHGTSSFRMGMTVFYDSGDLHAPPGRVRASAAGRQIKCANVTVYCAGNISCRPTATCDPMPPPPCEDCEDSDVYRLTVKAGGETIGGRPLRWRNPNHPATEPPSYVPMSYKLFYGDCADNYGIYEVKVLPTSGSQPNIVVIQGTQLQPMPGSNLMSPVEFNIVQDASTCTAGNNPSSQPTTERCYEKSTHELAIAAKVTDTANGGVLEFLHMEYHGLELTGLSSPVPQRGGLCPEHALKFIHRYFHEKCGNSVAFDNLTVTADEFKDGGAECVGELERCYTFLFVEYTVRPVQVKPSYWCQGCVAHGPHAPGPHNKPQSELTAAFYQGVASGGGPASGPHGWAAELTTHWGLDSGQVERTCVVDPLTGEGCCSDGTVFTEVSYTEEICGGVTSYASYLWEFWILTELDDGAGGFLELDVDAVELTVDLAQSVENFRQSNDPAFIKRHPDLTTPCTFDTGGCVNTAGTLLDLCQPGTVDVVLDQSGVPMVLEVWFSDRYNVERQPSPDGPCDAGVSVTEVTAWWFDASGNPYNMRTFGSEADPVAKAIEWAQANFAGGPAPTGRVEIPSGTYITEGPFLIWEPIEIIGDGMLDSVLAPANAVQAVGFFLVQANGARFKDFAIHGGGDIFRGLEVYSSECVIECILVRDTLDHAVWIGTTVGTDASHNRVSDCVLFHTGDGDGENSPTWQYQHVVAVAGDENQILRNEISEPGGAGILIGRGIGNTVHGNLVTGGQAGIATVGTAGESVIEDNTVVAALTGIQIADTIGFNVVVENTVNDSLGQNIWLDERSSPGVNRIDTNTLSGGAGGIWVSGGTDSSLLVANSVVAPAGAGITLRDCTGLDVRDNEVRESLREGILVDGVSTTNLLEANRLICTFLGMAGYPTGVPRPALTFDANTSGNGATGTVVEHHTPAGYRRDLGLGNLVNGSTVTLCTGP